MANFNKFGPISEENIVSYANNKCQGQNAPSKQDLHLSSIYSLVSKDSVSVQRNPGSDCAYAQPGLGVRCSHMT